jgi:CRISPR/Cas system endoribonuclease Cas6 (RAMP superfamily)
VKIAKKSMLLATVQGDFAQNFVQEVFQLRMKQIMKRKLHAKNVVSLLWSTKEQQHLMYYAPIVG